MKFDESYNFFMGINKSKNICNNSNFFSNAPDKSYNSNLSNNTTKTDICHANNNGQQYLNLIKKLK